MTQMHSDCSDAFGHQSFDLNAIDRSSYSRCPIWGCHAKLEEVPVDTKGTLRPWCPVHGIRLHTGTFVYWNGDGRNDEARLRNFIVRPDLVRKIALAKGKKAESHRLGYEMSEDALSWNVFVSLAAASRLRQAAKGLTGRMLSKEPELYLWGRRIDLSGGEDMRHPELDRVGSLLEQGITNFRTEPDIMLVAPGELLVCIEAKFGSGNTMADGAPTKDGQKPTSRSALLSRYLEPSAHAGAVILPEAIPEEFHSQLFRNIVFACEMARGTPWHVVNLVSETQWALAKVASQAGASIGKYSFADPTPAVHAYLRDESRSCFTFRTWEELHANVIKGEANLGALNAYLRGKSAHFRPAFELG